MFWKYMGIEDLNFGRWEFWDPTEISKLQLSDSLGVQFYEPSLVWIAKVSYSGNHSKEKRAMTWYTCLLAGGTAMLI
jgi:hypothetical protein